MGNDGLDIRVLLIVGIIAFLYLNPIHSQPNPNPTPTPQPTPNPLSTMRIGVCYYGNYQDWSQITDATLNRDFSLFKSKGIKVITLPTFWDALEGATPGSYNQAVFDRLKHITSVAASYGIDVVDNIHTWYTGTNVPAYVGNQRNIYVDPAIEQDWLNFVTYYVRELDASNVESFQVWNELGPESWCMNVSPQQFYDTSQATVSAARAATSKPISARFSGAGATDVEDRVYSLFDYFATNYYDSFNNPLQLQGIIDRAKAMGKQVWICEYGDSTPDDAAQASYYANDLNLFQSKGINTAIAWWYSGSAGVGDLGYQIRGRPAFDTMCGYIKTS